MDHLLDIFLYIQIQYLMRNLRFSRWWRSKSISSGLLAPRHETRYLFHHH